MVQDITLPRVSFLKAVSSDPKLPDAFTELDDTGNLTVDIEALKLHMINKAALCDGKDNFLKGRKNKGVSVNQPELYYDASCEEIDGEYAIYQTSRTPGNTAARMPEALFCTMEPRDRAGWTKIPENLRMVLVKLLNGTKKASPTALVEVLTTTK